MDGNLSQWVSQVQERHRSGGRGDEEDEHIDVLAKSPSASAADLEEEIRRSRVDRANRRSQIGGGILSPTSTGNTPFTSNAYPTTSKEDTFPRSAGERGVTLPLPATKSIYQPATSTPSFGSRRSNALLDRYGGAAGPTGTANAGCDGSPASLASFMGGKASGPRLGKLQGDGRSAPPEASMIDDTMRRPMPGMTGGGLPLASFLESRAGGQNARYNPAVTAATDSTPKEKAFTAARPQSVRTESSETAHRTPKTSDIANRTSGYTQRDTHTGQRNDRATSPLKAGQIGETKEMTPSQFGAIEARRIESFSRSSDPVSSMLSPTSDALRSDAQSSRRTSPPSNADAGASAPVPVTQQTLDRMPTASLTRLKSKKMVEQRIREAQERASTDPGPQTSSTARQYSAREAVIPEPSHTATDVKIRWPDVGKKISPTPDGESSYKFGNALPGMRQSSAVPSRNLYAFNQRADEDRENVSVAPIRLPGMGSSQSPFAWKQITAGTSEESQGSVAQPLEQLAKGRAKPKRAIKSSAMAVSSPVEEQSSLLADKQGTEEQRSRDAFYTDVGKFEQDRPRSPSKVPVLSIHTNTFSTHPDSRKDSMPDSAERRIADSTAALEALLEGKNVKTPTYEASRSSYIPEPSERTGTLKIARNKDSYITIDTSSVLASSSSPSSTGENDIMPKVVTLDVLSIGPDGSSMPLKGEEGKILYETETQVIIARFKDATRTATSNGGPMATKVFARTGRMSRLLTDPYCVEARKVQEIGKQIRAEGVVDARQGRESVELVRMLGGLIVTREGSRKDFEAKGHCLYDVRGCEGASYIDQVDMLSSSLCSAHSAVATLLENVFVWHGRGATSSIRQIALQYARQLQGNIHQRTTPLPSSSITEYEEGREDELFWTCFDKSTAFSNAWHHRLRPLLPESELVPRLYSIHGGAGVSTKKLVEQSEFSLLDVRRDGVHILQLPLETYILIGPGARSKRKEIQTCIEVADKMVKTSCKVRGPSMMTAPIHVIAFPSIPPRELKTAFRYWQDDHLNGKSWQRAALRMNCWEKQAALEQLNCMEFPLWQLNDEVFLPIGVGLEDVQGVDV
ncbi:hypothetical protein CBS101457_006484 [Exobasidium rhododendri]|nr:hypothetical protein CBS101457_006484 [Exobasidium rhododendri]